MSHSLKGKKIAFLAADGFEQSEFERPWNACKDAGATVHLISLEEGDIYGVRGDIQKGDTFPVDKTIEQVSADDYTGLVLPGGLKNPDTLRQNPKAVAFIRDFFEQHKPVSAICHAPQLLIEACVVENRKLTSYPSIKTDLENAGAKWVDEECVCEDGLTTSRSPDDLDAFCAKTVEEMAEGKHDDQVANAA